MVVEELLHAIPIADPRSGRSDPNERKKRKEYEKKHPHFQMQEFGLKAGVLALMAAVAAIPISKKYDEHVRNEHPERLEKGKGDGERKRSEDRERERERERERDGGRERRDPRRRMTVQEGSAGGRQRAYVEDRSRRGSVGAGSDGRRSLRSNIDDGRGRRSIDGRSLRLAVADGYEYIPPYRGYVEEKGRTDDGWDRRSARASADEYRHRDRRSGAR
jgi:hypothetical protein